MSIETLRAEIRGIETEIQTLKKQPGHMTKKTLEEIHACFHRKWELEKQIKLVTKAA